MNPLNNRTILVIEDDESICRTLADMLELNGFRAVLATNGTEGLAAARREEPSLIITDLAMPGMTGYELLETFRKDPNLRTVPVVVISARADRATTRRGMELGAADFITKPFTEEEVIRSIATRLERQELLEELDAFSHTVAHDLKNPLFTLTGRIELAALALGKRDEATVRHHLDEAAATGRQLNAIIEELLVFAGVRRQSVLSVPLDMANLVGEAIDRLEHLLRRQPARIQKPSSWPAAIGHPPWIVEVWTNYLSNAVKYGGAAPRIELGGKVRPDGSFARFWVQDSGPGIDRAAQKEMFVPFSRVSTGRTDSHGLGLSIVRRIVERLGGQVGVISSPGEGTRFWFELPTGSKAQSSPGVAAP
jgi:signal transduction histidine kinase